MWPWEMGIAGVVQMEGQTDNTEETSVGDELLEAEGKLRPEERAAPLRDEVMKARAPQRRGPDSCLTAGLFLTLCQHSQVWGELNERHLKPVPIFGLIDSASLAGRVVPASCGAGGSRGAGGSGTSCNKLLLLVNEKIPQSLPFEGIFVKPSHGKATLQTQWQDSVPVT